MKTNMRCRGAPKGQPKLFYVLATSLTLSICGLRALVSSFLLACPSGPFAKSSVHTRRSEGFVGPPGSSGATRGISRPLWRTRPSIVSRVCPSWAIRGTRINEDDVVEDGLNTGEADGADGFGCHRREVHGEQSQELFGRLPGSSISAFGEEDPGGERARSRGGGVARADFVRSVMGGLVTAPMIAGLLSSGEGQAAEAATLDRTRLGTPILTESVLLDLLPISGNGANALRAIQDEIEKATILRTLYRRVNYSQTGSIVEQLAVPPSVWDRVLAVSEGALEMLMEARPALEPVFREMDSAETQIRRAEYSEEVFARTKEALKRMATGARTRLPPSVLSAQEDALLELGRIGELFDSGFPFEIDAGEMYDSIPRLLGRATVDVTVRRDAENPKSKGKVLGNVTMVVDGYSSPVTAGNFIDLALRGFYNELPIRFDGVPAEAQVGADNNETLSTVVSGSFREGFVDPATGALRRLPLEILRVERKGNAPVYGAARNTKVFTKAPAVQTFRIPGAIAMNHPALDGNGASSEFFWLQDDNLEKDGYLMNQGVEALDGRYAIFAYAVGNRKLLGRLKGGDVIEKVTVTYGEDNLIRPKSASFTELLLKGGNGDDAE